MAETLAERTNEIESHLRRMTFISRLEILANLFEDSLHEPWRVVGEHLEVDGDKTKLTVKVELGINKVRQNFLVSFELDNT